MIAEKDIPGFKNFLIKAKLSGYASGKEPVLTNHGGIEVKKYFFQKGNFAYTDEYLGSNPFSGSELVIFDGNAIWRMNYYGRIDPAQLLQAEINEKTVFDFLRKALLQVQEAFPFRSTRTYQNGSWEYINRILKSDLECFRGCETILFQDKEVFRLDYHGGEL